MTWGFHANKESAEEGKDGQPDKEQPPAYADVDPEKPEVEVKKGNFMLETVDVERSTNLLFDENSDKWFSMGIHVKILTCWITYLQVGTVECRV